MTITFKKNSSNSSETNSQRSKNDSKNKMDNVNVRLNPEALESREMMSVNPLASDWVGSIPFAKAELPQMRSALMDTVEHDASITSGSVIAQNEWIIQMSDSLMESVKNVNQAQKYFSSLGVTVVEGLGAPGSLHVIVNSGTFEQQSEFLSTIVGLVNFEPNRFIVGAATPVNTNDPGASNLWNVTQTDTSAAWGVSDGTGTIVAVLDSGVDINHPDLKNNIWRNSNPGAYGYANDINGYNFYSNNNNVADDHSHGTHVAGTIAAVANNGIGIAGVAPKTQILPLKFLNSNGNGFSSDATRAINYVVSLKNAGNNIVAINCSFASDSYSSTLDAAIQKAGKAGVVVVAAAGNDARNIDTSPIYPASINATNVITVAATDSGGNLASYSNYGVKTVDVAAPGSNIYSTMPGGGYGTKSGTSMATPLVSGMVALIAATNPKLTPEQIKSVIASSATTNSGLATKVATGGIVNVATAVGSLATTAPKAPVGLTSTASGSTSLVVSWQASIGATSYKLEYATSANGTWTTAYTGSSTSFSLSGLSANTQYFLRVSASNKIGSSSVSSVTSGKTLEAGSSLFQMTEKAGTVATFQWTALSGATSYVVQASSNGGASWSTVYTGNQL
ncbi:MAG: S8 family serine peptidase, partial [Thermoguttaceae bacterium]